MKREIAMRTDLKATRALGPLSIVAYLVLFSTPSLAGPPFQTDDPEPSRNDRFSGYLAYQWTF